jgi:hypothetical protein
VAPALILPIALGFFVTWLVLYGMTHGLQTWLASFLEALAHPRGSLWKRAALLPVSLAAGAVLYVYRTVGHRISQVASHGVARVASYIGSWAVWIQHHAVVLGDFATEVATGFERLVSHTIPHVVAREVAPVFKGIDRLEGEVRSLAHRLAVYARGIDRLLKHTILPQLRHLTHMVDVTLPRAVGRTGSRVGALERRLLNPPKSLVKRWWKLGWVLIGAGLMLKLLAKKFPYLFCRNVKKVAQSICRPSMNQVVDLLLADAVAAFAIADMCDTIAAMETVAEQFEPLLEQLVKVEFATFGFCGHDLPTGHDTGDYRGSWLATGQE